MTHEGHTTGYSCHIVQHSAAFPRFDTHLWTAPIVSLDSLLIFNVAAKLQWCIMRSRAANRRDASTPANRRQRDHWQVCSAWQWLLTNMVSHNTSDSASNVPNWQGQFGFGADQQENRKLLKKKQIDWLQICPQRMETFPTWRLVCSTVRHYYFWSYVCLHLLDKLVIKAADYYFFQLWILTFYNVYSKY